MTPFEVLGLPPDAVPSEVRAAHRLLVADAHREHPASSQAWSDQMAELNVARDAAMKVTLAAPCRACGGTGKDADGVFLCGACSGTKRNPEK